MLSLVACLALVQGKEIQVAPGADLAAAAAQAGPGGTVTLAPGRYPSGPVSLGPSLAGLTIRSKPGGRAVIDFEGKGGFYLKADKATLKDLDVLNAQNFGIDVDASDVTLDGCKVLGSGGDAIKLSPGPWQQKKYNKGATIVRCEIGANKAFEGIDCVGMDDVKVLQCLIRDTPGWGIYLKGGATRGLVEGCTFVRCGTLANNPAGGVVLGEATGPDAVMTNKHGQAWESVDCVVRNNLFIDIDSAAMAAWCAKNATFANNTCVNVATRDRAAFIALSNHGLPSTDITFVNNVVVGSKAGNKPLVWFYAKGAAGKLVFENNCWWGGNGKFWNQDAGGPVDFAAWQAAGLDKASLFADPKLDEKHRPAAGSPCIDKARSIPGFAADLDGRKRNGAWDIGAFESGTSK